MATKRCSYYYWLMHFLSLHKLSRNNNPLKELSIGCCAKGICWVTLPFQKFRWMAFTAYRNKIVYSLTILKHKMFFHSIQMFWMYASVSTFEVSNNIQTREGLGTDTRYSNWRVYFNVLRFSPYLLFSIDNTLFNIFYKSNFWNK